MSTTQKIIDDGDALVIRQIVPVVLLAIAFMVAVGVLTTDRPGDTPVDIPFAEVTVSELPNYFDDEDFEERVGYNGPEALPGVFGATPRSPKWRKLRDEYFIHNPQCAFQGCESEGPFNVHHIQPFHLHPELELDPDNLITLCAGVRNHHLWIGHQGNFADYNPNVVRDCEAGVWPMKAVERLHRASEKKTTLAP